HPAEPNCASTGSIGAARPGFISTSTGRRRSYVISGFLSLALVISAISADLPRWSFMKVRSSFPGPDHDPTHPPQQPSPDCQFRPDQIRGTVSRHSHYVGDGRKNHRAGECAAGTRPRGRVPPFVAPGTDAGVW